MTNNLLRSVQRSFNTVLPGKPAGTGYVDQVCASTFKVSGWAVKRSDQKPEVALYVNGKLKHEAFATEFRQDLIAAGYADALGFGFSIQPYLDSGVNEIDIRYADTNKTIPNGRKTIQLDGSSHLPIKANAYETLYETHASLEKDQTSVGDGDYYKIGLIEFELLKMEGLKASNTLVDFGCGNGRLAVHVVPFLNQQAKYIGIDIAETYLQHADQRIKQAVPHRACQLEWVHQNTSRFAMPDQSVDMICAFSVFTHMENEDSYHYLKSALRIMKPGGKFIFSCLPLTLEAARNIFLAEAEMSLNARWQRVRNVATSKDLMISLSEMAGWKVVNWYDGDKCNIGLPGGEMSGLGQSSCILQAP